MNVVSPKLVLVLGKVAVVWMAAATVACSSAPGETPKVPVTEAHEGGGLVGQPAPLVAAEFVVGDGPKTLAEAHGTVTIVDFWGTFCEPCKKSFPKLQELVDTQAGKLTILAVSQDDPDETKADDIKKFVENLHVTFPVLWDKDKKTANVYHPPKMPTSYIVDKKGVVRFVHGGYTDGEEEKVAKEVELLVAE